MQFQSRRVQTASVEITPLIDIVFILLIFFMVTSTFVSNPKLDISLPESTTSVLPNPPNTIDIFIDKFGLFAVGESLPQSTTKESVLEALRSFVSTSEDPTVLVHADAETRHQVVVDVLTAAAELNLNKVHLVSKASNYP